MWVSGLKFSYSILRLIGKPDFYKVAAAAFAADEVDHRFSPFSFASRASIAISITSVVGNLGMLLLSSAENHRLLLPGLEALPAVINGVLSVGFSLGPVKTWRLFHFAVV